MTRTQPTRCDRLWGVQCRWSRLWSTLPGPRKAPAYLQIIWSGARWMRTCVGHSRRYVTGPCLSLDIGMSPSLFCEWRDGQRRMPGEERLRNHHYRHRHHRCQHYRHRCTVKMLREIVEGKYEILAVELYSGIGHSSSLFSNQPYTGYCGGVRGCRQFSRMSTIHPSTHSSYHESVLTR